jgi:hypothetical protein
LLKLQLFCLPPWSNITKSFWYNWEPHLEVTGEEKWRVPCRTLVIFSNPW